MATKNPNRRTNPRKHIRSFNLLELETVLKRLDQMKFSAEGKAMLRRMLQAASNPNSEAPEVVIQTLEPERRVNIEQTMQEVGGVFVGIVRRGGQSITAMDDAEWDALLSEG